MRQRQDEVFSVVVENPEGQFIVMILTINRVELHVVQVSCIQPRFHLYQKPRPPISCGRNAEEIGRLLSHCHRTGNLLTKNTVGITQEFNRFKILAPAKFVRDPLPLYGCSRGKSLTPPHDAQRINTKTFNPVKRVTDEEVTDFTATIVVDQRVPVLMIAFTRIAVFIQVRAIKFGKRKVISREVARTQSRITFRPAACAASMK